MEYHFGEKLRAVRERQKLTLREVAARAGVSESLVSQIERERVSPAIDTLLALVDALDLDPEYFFAGYRRERPVRLLRREERSSFTRNGALYERFAQLEGNQGIEAYLITLKGGEATGSREYGHRGWELGIVQEGRAELTVGKRSYTLGAGDSVSFKSDSPHTLSNPGRKTLRMVWVITPPRWDGENR
ncbi:MAG: XRE family transcriptional regulator [Spirochaetaceae bacterium]|jgi:transcriptional regulator with XRE-family HTH domain|nr:XRE family transcriptional regulator [Spirochaetaceae bacterium]